MLYQVFLVILPLITTPYVSRVLGSEGVGTYSFTLSIVTYFTLFGSLGVSIYGRREIAYRQNDKKDRSETFWQIMLVKFIAMTISMIVFYFTCIQNTEYGRYYTILVLELIANMFAIGWYYQGLENFKTISIRNMIIKTLGVLAIFIFVKSPDDLWIYMLIYCFADLFGDLWLWVQLPKTLEKVKLDLKGARRHLPPILMMFLPQITIEIYTVLDKTMLGFLMHDMSEVGIYEQSQKVEKVSLHIITALGPVMGARIASLFAEGNKEKIIDNLKKSFHFIWVLATPITFGIAAIAPNLVPWFLGEEFLPAIPIMQIGALLIFAISLSNATGYQYLIPTKHQGIFTASVMVGAIVNFLGNLVLIPIFGAVGAIVSSVVAECSVAIVQLVFVHKTIHIKDIFSQSIKTIPAGIVMFAVVFALGFVLPKTILGTLIQVVSGGLVYVFIMTIAKDTFILDGWKTLNKLKSKLLRKHA
jgi:O-antigen/teichoic acid export membrane protein